MIFLPPPAPVAPARVAPAPHPPTAARYARTAITAPQHTPFHFAAACCWYLKTHGEIISHRPATTTHQRAQTNAAPPPQTSSRHD